MQLEGETAETGGEETEQSAVKFTRQVMIYYSSVGCCTGLSSCPGVCPDSSAPRECGHLARRTTRRKRRWKTKHPKCRC